MDPDHRAKDNGRYFVVHKTRSGFGPPRWQLNYPSDSYRDAAFWAEKMAGSKDCTIAYVVKIEAVYWGPNRVKPPKP